MQGRDRSRLPNTRQARRFAFRPNATLLEERLTLTGNIALTNAFLVNGNDQPLSTVRPGQAVVIEAVFSTQGLPSNAAYRLNYTVNGLTEQTGLLS
jgi:hypothetical protein